MSARDQMSKMLDQLLGQDRDGDDKSLAKHFTDKTVCRPFLFGICICELFINTRAELGECGKVHSVALKADFEEANMERDYRYEEEVLEHLRAFLKDNERKIETAKKRLTLVDENPEMESKVDEIHELSVEIGEKVAKAEALGAEGNVDESLHMMQEVEEVKAKKKALEDQYHSLIPRHAAQQQKLRACEVCGAFLSMYDNDRRLADHFGGKLHIGFVTIRDKITQLEEAVRKKDEKRRLEREEYQKERERRRQRSRSRSKEKEQRRRSHSRERDRSRRSSRSRERDRRRERGGGGGGGRERERERRRSRDRGRSDRSKRERSRSRERRRSGSR